MLGRALVPALLLGDALFVGAHLAASHLGAALAGRQASIAGLASTTQAAGERFGSAVLASGPVASARAGAGRPAASAREPVGR